jgi:decaprenyl-phosphate phosphoribosyltransferase
MIWLQQIRFKEWLKNLFVFLPVFFAGRFSERALIEPLLAGFAAFCALASAVYCLNDWLDVQQDREHPIKKFRPFASGQLNTQQMRLLLGICLLAAFGFSFFVPHQAKLVLLAYLLLQLSYSYFLKKIAVLDCVAIAFGFVLRVLFGGLFMGTTGSSWILIMTFLLSLYLAFAKRRSELATVEGHQTRLSLAGYTLKFLDISLAVTCAITVVSYIMYTHDKTVLERIHFFPYFYLSSIFVLVGMLRHLQQTILLSKTESPAEYLIKDKLLLVTIVAWICFNAAVIYWYR